MADSGDPGLRPALPAQDGSSVCPDQSRIVDRAHHALSDITVAIKIRIVPYVQPTGFLVAGDRPSDFLFDLGLGADFRLTPRFDARISAGLGDLEGVSISAVWVH